MEPRQRASLVAAASLIVAAGASAEAGPPGPEELARFLVPFGVPGAGFDGPLPPEDLAAGLPFAAPALAAGLTETLWRAQGDIERLDTGVRVALDADAPLPNPVVAGYYYKAQPYEGFNGVLAKFNAAGELAYRAGVHLQDLEVLYGVALDAAGNAVGGGYSIAFTDATHFLYKMLAVKVDAAGDVLWVREVRPDPDNIYNLALDVAVDAEGNVVLGGYSIGTTPGFSYDADVAKLDPDGNVVWAKRLDIPYNHELIQSVAVDAAGNIYLGGSTLGPGGWDGLVLKLDPQGNLLARKAVVAPTSDLVTGIAVDAQGHVLLAGTSTGGPLPVASAAFLARLTPDLQLDWALALVAGAETTGTDVAVDRLGNAVVGGSAYNAGTRHDVFVAKVSPAGAVLFTRLVDASPTGDAWGFGAATTPDGLVVATAGTVATGQGATDLFVTKGLGAGAAGGAGGALNTALNAEAIVLG